MNYMNRVIIIISIVMLFISSCKKSDDPVNDNAIDYQTELQKIVDDNWTKFIDGRDGVPGGYALQIMSPHGDFFVSTGGLNEATNETHFRAASTTKMFTAAAVMLLHQREKLNIYDFVTDTIPETSITYLPATDEFNIPFKDQITIKQLLQHRAGLYDLINQDVPDDVDKPYAGYRYVDYVEEVLAEPFHTFTINEMAAVIADNQLYNSAPDVQFYYSDTGMSLLAFIVERVTGAKFENFLTDNLLVPNGLNNTTFPSSGDDVVMPSPFASGYVYLDGQVYDFTEQNVSMSVGEGNVVTTPKDLATWVSKLYSGKAGIDYKNVRYLMMDCLPTYEVHQYYGFGTVFTDDLGYGHNGAKTGYFTSTRYNPDNGVTYVIYSNVWDFESMEFDLMTQVIDMYGVAYEAMELMGGEE